MLKFYIPTMNGVNVVLAESGMEPLGGIWSGTYSEYDGWNYNQLTLANGYLRAATEEEIEARQTPNKYKEVMAEPDYINKSSGIWRIYTIEEKQAVDDAEEAANEAQEAINEANMIEAEANMQLNKSLALKSVENNFLLLCEQLLGSRVKASFGYLNTALTTLLAMDQGLAVVLSIKLLALDAEGKREGGLNWWDTITWHDDIVYSSSSSSSYSV